MRKKITVRWLKKIGACNEAVEAFKGQKETDPIRLLNKMIRNGKESWANWLIVRLMTYKQYVSYAVFAAEQVIDNYKKKYPDDKIPRNAIKAARKCIKNPSKANKSEANSAANSAYLAAYSAYSAYLAANATANAAYLAANAAANAAYWATYSAAYSAANLAANSAYLAANAAAYSAYWTNSAPNAAVNSANLAAYSANAAYSAVYIMRKKILKYGIGLLYD